MFRGGRSIFPVKDEIGRGKKICRYSKENVSSTVLDFIFFHIRYNRFYIFMIKKMFYYVRLIIFVIE